MTISKTSHISVKAPRTLEKKNRYLPEAYLYPIIWEARKYDPMIALGIALQAFGGLRESGVINLMIGSIKIKNRLGETEGISIDLNQDAPHVKRCTGKTDRGHIKKKRTQEIYKNPYFLAETVKLLDEHMSLLRRKGYPTDKKAPLFRDDYGRPMSVQTYCNHVKALWHDHFLPHLRRMSEAEGRTDDIAFLERWEDSVDMKTEKVINGEYPGAHMFRHWFTMHLINVEGLEASEVMKCRGDSSIQSMVDYISVNQGFIKIFQSCVSALQEEVWNRI